MRCYTLFFAIGVNGLMAIETLMLDLLTLIVSMASALSMQQIPAPEMRLRLQSSFFLQQPVGKYNAAPEALAKVGVPTGLSRLSMKPLVKVRIESFTNPQEPPPLSQYAVSHLGSRVSWVNQCSHHGSPKLHTGFPELQTRKTCLAAVKNMLQQ